MTQIPSTIPVYNPEHTDYKKKRYFPHTSLLSFNQMIDLLADPFVTLAVDTLCDQFYITSYGHGDDIQPLATVDIEMEHCSEMIDELENNSLIECFGINGEPFGSAMTAWDIYREGVSNKRSKESEILARKTRIKEGARLHSINHLMIKHKLKHQTLKMTEYYLNPESKKINNEFLNVSERQIEFAVGDVSNMKAPTTCDFKHKLICVNEDGRYKVAITCQNEWLEKNVTVITNSGNIGVTPFFGGHLSLLKAHDQDGNELSLRGFFEDEELREADENLYIDGICKTLISGSDNDELVSSKY